MLKLKSNIMELTFEQLPSAVAKILEYLEMIEKLLNQNQERSDSNDIFLHIQETSEFLNLSVPTIYGYTSRQEIPHNKRGKRIYFLKSDLIEWLKSGKRKILSELKAEAESYIERIRNKRKW